MTMNCQDAREWMIDRLYGEPPGELETRLESHQAGCEACRGEWDRLQALAAALDGWTDPSPPAGLTERVLARLARKRAETAERRLPVVPLERAIGAMLAGALAAGISLLLVSGATPGWVSPLELGLLGALWTMIYGGAFILAQSVGFGALGRAALTGAGLSLILVPLLTIPGAVEACLRLAKVVVGMSGPEGLAIALGAAIYTAVPVLVGGALFGGRTGRVTDGLLQGALYGLLIAPAVFLQCLPLPLETTAAWMAGALAGAALGGLGTTKVSSWRGRLAA